MDVAVRWLGMALVAGVVVALGVADYAGDLTEWRAARFVIVGAVVVLLYDVVVVRRTRRSRRH